LRTGDYVILDVVRHHIRFGDWEKFVLEQAFKDGKSVDIILPIDPNPAAMAATQMLVRAIVPKGFFVTTKRASSAKVDRFRPFSSACQNGLVSIVKNCATDLWNKVYNDNSFFYNELEMFEGKREINDMADAAADGFSYIAQQNILPVGFLSGMKSFDTSNKSPLLNIK